MTTSTTLVNNLRGLGERITAVRRAILDILSNQKQPLSAKEILLRLKKKKMPVNKTTIYRQLSLLEFYEIARPIRFADRTVRYEIASPGDHHHHLVCTRCHQTENASFAEDLERQIKIIRQKNQFEVSQHALEFFGLCRNCQKKKKTNLSSGAPNDRDTRRLRPSGP